MTGEQRSYDAVIVGGGVIGCAMAYYLAREGQRVILLERGRLASEASGAAAGMLGVQSEMHEPGPLFELARQSRAMFPHLAEALREESGIDIGLIRKGMLKVAWTEQEGKLLRDRMRWQIAMRERAEWFTAEEACRCEPALVGEIAGALWLPDEGHVLAQRLAQAWACAAAANGAEVREETEVAELLVEAGRVRGVRTRDGVVRGERVAVAAATWSDPLLAAVGCELGLYPVKGECFTVLTGAAPLLRHTVSAEGCYLVPKPGGRLLVGATSQEHAVSRSPTAGGIAALLERAGKLVPALAGAEWERAWAGLRPKSADGLPFLGAVPAVEGLYAAAGHFRNGVLLSPITGRLIADLMLNRLDEVGKELLAPFRVDRLQSI